MADPYGLIASGLPPDLVSQMMGLQGRQAISQALLSQSQQPLEETQVKGRFSVPISPIQGIAKVMQAYMGAKGLNQGYQDMADVSKKYQSGLSDAYSNYIKTKEGTPEVPAQISPYPVSGSPATPGDPKKAIINALSNPYLRNSPLLAADLKKYEPNWSVHKQFDPETGMEKEVLVNLNNPSETKPFGGTKAQEMHFADAGGEIVPVPKTSTTPIKKTIDPNKVGDPSSIELNAQAIANGQLQPLSSFAMKTPQGAQIMARVMQINPQYDAKDWTTHTKAEKDFATGKQGNTVRSFNVALSHLDTLDKLSEALNNGDVKLINKLSNEYASQTGGTAPGNFDAAKKIVGDEIVKAIVGSGGGVTDREEAAKTISSANSPAQLQGVIRTYKELMMGQIKGLQKQHEAATGKNNFSDKYLSPDVKNMMSETKNQSTYIETRKTANGRTLGKKADGTIEEIK